MKISFKDKMRNYADILHLIIINNLQNTNAELIEKKIPQREKFIRLNNSVNE